MPYVFINCITHWEAYSRQSCYAAGQSSAERASDKDSLLHGHRFAETQVLNTFLHANIRTSAKPATRYIQ